MTDLPDRLRDSPIDFGTAVAYALQPEMRRLIILYLIGVLLLPVGVDLFFTTGFRFLPALIESVVGLGLIVVGATFLFGGLVGAAFKLVTDANLVAMAAGTGEHARRD